uniref:Pseudomonapepsin n=1 Tax=Thermogemmatispora argillosa TaxID=2045280 RepID=A0A455T7W3_9CHLR|nr:pseudomonapepsin [Thermogemmatispora argillosa]
MKKDSRLRATASVRTVASQLLSWLMTLMVVSLLDGCNLLASPGTAQHGSSPTPTAVIPRQAPSPLPPEHQIVDLPTLRQLPGGQPLPANLSLSLSFTLIYNNDALDRTLRQIYTPGSPLYGHYLTPQQIRQSFGPDEQQITLVKQWLLDQGYQVGAVDPLATQLEVTATVATIERSLHLQLREYELNGQHFYLASGVPSLPPQIASLVQSIIGLSTFAMPRPWSFFEPLGPALAGTQGAAACSKYGAKQSLTRAQLAGAYQFTQLYQRGLQGQGISIGIAEFSEPFDPRDIVTYAACAGVPAPRIQVVDVQGHTPRGPGQGEAALDIELAASLAPQAQIVVYQAAQASIQAMLAVFQRVAAENRVQVFSVSYGAAEDQLSTNEQEIFNQLLRIIAAEGISVLISSGDCGAFTERIPNIAVVSAPANAPFAIAVGGTTLTVDRQNRRQSESGWGRDQDAGFICRNDWGSGGGVSQTAAFKRPYWQVGPGMDTSYNGQRGHILTPNLEPLQAPNGLRQVPDVAAAADNICIFWHGQWIRVGGTSAAAPIWAAGLALVNQGLRQEHAPLFGGVPTVYRLAHQSGNPAPFNDILRGDNGLYQATRGWDYVTGWGSPNFLALLQRLR